MLAAAAAAFPCCPRLLPDTPNPARSPRQALLLAGFYIEELATVRQLLDQVGADSVRVLPSTPAALHEPVAAALAAPQPAWDRPVSPEWMHGGGWGQQRMVLMAGLRWVGGCCANCCVVRSARGGGASIGSCLAAVLTAVLHRSACPAGRRAWDAPPARGFLQPSGMPTSCPSCCRQQAKPHRPRRPPPRPREEQAPAIQSQRADVEVSACPAVANPANLAAPLGQVLADALKLWRQALPAASSSTGAPSGDGAAEAAAARAAPDVPFVEELPPLEEVLPAEVWQPQRPAQRQRQQQQQAGGGVAEVLQAEFSEAGPLDIIDAIATSAEPRVFGRGRRGGAAGGPAGADDDDGDDDDAALAGAFDQQGRGGGGRAGRAGRAADSCCV